MFCMYRVHYALYICFMCIMFTMHTHIYIVYISHTGRSVRNGTFSDSFPSLKHWGGFFSDEKPLLEVQSLWEIFCIYINLKYSQCIHSLLIFEGKKKALVCILSGVIFEPFVVIISITNLPWVTNLTFSVVAPTLFLFLNG